MADRDAGASRVLSRRPGSSAHTPVFSDGFESGNLSSWTKINGMTVVTAPVHSGTHAAQGIAPTGSAGAYAYKTLPSTYATGYARVWFYVASNTGQINLLRVRSSTSTAYVLVKSTGVLALNNGGTGSISSTTTVSRGAWHELELSVTAGTTSSDSVWLDGNVVTALTGAAAFGSSPIQTVQIGEAASETWNVVFDDAAFDTQMLP